MCSNPRVPMWETLFVYNFIVRLVGVEIRWILAPIALKIWQGPTKRYDQGPKWPLKLLAHFNT